LFRHQTIRLYENLVVSFGFYNFGTIISVVDKTNIVDKSPKKPCDDRLARRRPIYNHKANVFKFYLRLKS